MKNLAARFIVLWPGVGVTPSWAFLWLLVLGMGLATTQEGAWALNMQARPFYQQAITAERQGDLDGAERALRQAIVMDPQDYLNFVKLGSILNQQGKPNEAVKYYQQALSLNPRDTMILYSLGEVYEQLGQYAKAEEAYALSLQNNPTYQFALLNLARTEIQQQKYPAAITHYEQFLNRYPDHYEARRHLGKLFLATGQEAKSVQQYDWLKQHFPNRFGEHLDLARALNGANAPAQALEELKVAYQKEGSKSDISEEMGRAHAALGQLDLAIHNYQRAYSLTPQKDELLVRIADLYRAEEKPEPAIANYQSYLKLHPGNQQVRRVLINTYFDDKRFDLALNELQLLQPAVKTPDEQYQVRKDMAYATQMLGDLPKAIPLYESLLQAPQATKDLQLRSNLAIALAKTGDYAKSAALYKQVYYADPQLQAQYKLERPAVGSELAGVLISMGDAAYKSGDYNAALSHFNDATLYVPTSNYWAHLGLGNTYYALHMPDKADEAYSVVLERDPKNVMARLYKAKLALAKANIPPVATDNAQLTTKTPTETASAQSIAALEALAKENPTNFEVLTTLADAYAQQRNATAAVDTYEKALAVPGIAPEAQVQLLLSQGNQWQVLGNNEQAKNTYLRALALSDKMPMVHYNLGIVYNELGQLDQSAAAYRQALALDPSDGDSKYGLAITLEKQQKYQDALETYQAYAANPQARYFQQAQSRIHVLMQALRPASSLPSSGMKPVLPPVSSGAAPVGQAMSNALGAHSATTAASPASQVIPSDWANIQQINKRITPTDATPQPLHPASSGAGKL